MGRKSKVEKPQEEKKQRIAIVQADRCKPSKCNQECKRYCPVVAQGKLCVEVTSQSKTSTISESLCSGCGICVKKCPLNAIQIINLPTSLTQNTTHRYGPNGFKLHRLPMPRPGHVLGLLGTNGIGKSTAMNILAGKLKPNLGEHENQPDWKSIVAHFRGSELQTYFKYCLEERLTALTKPQYVERWVNLLRLPESALVGDVLKEKDDKGVGDTVIQQLQIAHLVNREVCKLSGGELQRLALAYVCVQKADVYLVDEPSAYLDIGQRLRAAQAIRDLVEDNSYVVVVEHDLAVLEYVSDHICCLWGHPGGYGVVTAPFGTREGINHFLAGYIPTENLRIRDEALTFHLSADTVTGTVERLHFTEYPSMFKTLRHGADAAGFRLEVEAGSFATSEIVVILGENGTGKTTLIQMLAGKLKPDNDTIELPKINVSYKPQMFTPSFPGTVRELLLQKVNKAFLDPQFQSDVVKPMLIDQIADLKVQNLSGGELQRVALVLALGKPADVYLIDEPSAYLDVEQRMAAARVIRRFILHQQKTAFIVEHDFVMATYLADRVMVFQGQPGVQCHALAPMPLVEGMNTFLKELGVTFRRAATNLRPRINKIGGTRDREQKQAGNYFLLEERL